MPRKYILAGLALAAVGIFAVAPAIAGGAADAVRVAAAIGGLIVVAYDTLRGDEVQRALALRAAGVAFLLSLAGAVAVVVLRTDAELVVRYGWAAMMGAWLLSWALLRARQA